MNITTDKNLLLRNQYVFKDLMNEKAILEANISESIKEFRERYGNNISLRDVRIIEEELFGSNNLRIQLIWQIREQE